LVVVVGAVACPLFSYFAAAVVMDLEAEGINVTMKVVSAGYCR
jgi:hypothetical protein